MRLPIRMLGVALGLGLLVGALPANAGSAKAITLNTCTGVPNTIYVAYMYGPTVNNVWRYATLTMTTSVKTPDFTNFTLCGVKYTGLNDKRAFTYSAWNISGTVVAYGTATFALDWYTVRFTTQIQHYGGVTLSASMTTELGGLPERCRWGWTTARPYPCESQHSISAQLP